MREMLFSDTDKLKKWLGENEGKVGVINIYPVPINSEEDRELIVKLEFDWLPLPFEPTEEELYGQETDSFIG